MLTVSIGSRRQNLLAAAWAAFLMLIVAGPWLAGGYWFGTDWPGPRRFELPGELSSTAFPQVILAAVSTVLSTEFTGKVLVFGVLFLAGLLAYVAAPAEGFVARAAAAAVFVVNPFVYGRLQYGQLFLLAGYAVLPWATLRVRRLFEEQGPASAALAALGLGAIGVLSPHVFVMALMLTAVLFASHLFARRANSADIARMSLWLSAAVGAALLASAYWIVPLVSGNGAEAAITAATGNEALKAFAAVPDPQLGLVPNVLGLYGFWAEGVGRFTSMKAFVPIWPLALAALLVVCAIGAAAALTGRVDRLRVWVAALMVAGGIALVLEIGYSLPLTRDLIGWLDSAFVPYRGMRDAAKWAALLALLYSQLAALGVTAILGWLSRRPPASRRAGWINGLAAGALLALPLSYGNGLLYGMHGEVTPSPYPAGWYAADQRLAADSHPGRTLFLPWHEYMTYSFVHNQDAVIASPAPSFFSVPVLASVDPEVPGLAPTPTADQAAVRALVTSGAAGAWAEVLSAHGVKYLLLAREFDWKAYGYLDGEPGLTKVGDYGSIVLYRDIQAPP